MASVASGENWETVGSGIHRVRDTCAVYLVETGEDDAAVAIDFGSGLVLDVAEELGLTIVAVLMTHHHRDQGQGLPLAVERGIPIHVPPVEVDLFSRVDDMWEATRLDNNYALRQERFSLLESVPVAGVVPEYRRFRTHGIELLVLPTPGHTMGSVTYLLERAGARLAFTGDLIYAPGKVWSLAASQWSYSNHEGAAMTVLSCLLLGDERPHVLYPSHGEPMDAAPALSELGAVMQEYVDSRRSYPWDLTARLRSPFVHITEHLLLNRSSMSCSYVLLSETGEALFIDYGYDMTTGILNETERAARRPWLASLPALREEFGVSRVSVGLPTHYHDDHLAGFPLLREVEGTELWVPENFAGIIADPWANDLPCQWYEPIPADRVLPLGEPFRWNEYEITAHEQPGHTLYAVAYELEVDGVRVVFTGDQQEGMGVPGERREFLNYQYRNRFALGDYRRSAELYRRIGPGLLASGHWEPRWVEEGYLDFLAAEGEFVDDIHRRLLPLEEVGIPADGSLARIAPYRSRLEPGGTSTYSVSVLNPHRYAATAVVQLVVPAGWTSTPPIASVELEAGGSVSLTFEVSAGVDEVRRARIAADVTVGLLRLGQHTEALVHVTTNP